MYAFGTVDPDGPAGATSPQGGYWTLSSRTWTAIAGSTIYMKFIFDFIISRHAPPFWGKKDSKVVAQ